MSFNIIAQDIINIQICVCFELFTLECFLKKEFIIFKIYIRYLYKTIIQFFTKIKLIIIFTVYILIDASWRIQNKKVWKLLVFHEIEMFIIFICFVFIIFDFWKQFWKLKIFLKFRFILLNVLNLIYIWEIIESIPKYWH